MLFIMLIYIYYTFIHIDKKKKKSTTDIKSVFVSLPA